MREMEENYSVEAANYQDTIGACRMRFQNMKEERDETSPARIPRPAECQDGARHRDRHLQEAAGRREESR